MFDGKVVQHDAYDYKVALNFLTTMQTLYSFRLTQAISENCSMYFFFMRASSSVCVSSPVEEFCPM